LTILGKSLKRAISPFARAPIPLVQSHNPHNTPNNAINACTTSTSSIATK